MYRLKEFYLVFMFTLVSPLYKLARNLGRIKEGEAISLERILSKRFIPIDPRDIKTFSDPEILDEKDIISWKNFKHTQKTEKQNA